VSISLSRLSAPGTGDAAAFSTLRKELSLLDAVAVAATWIGLFVLFAVIVFCVPFMLQ
jgi:hypothetical protein